MLDLFLHDIRSPLTVVGEFASMLQEGFFPEPAERSRTERAICEKTRESFFLIDVLDVFVRAIAEEAEFAREVLVAGQVLDTAKQQLVDHPSFEMQADVPAADSAGELVRCHPALAAQSLVCLWNYIDRRWRRDAVRDLELRCEPVAQGVLLIAGRRGGGFDTTRFLPVPPLSTSIDSEADDFCAHSDLMLFAGWELGRRAGGSVLMTGDANAAALQLPSAEDFDG